MSASVGLPQFSRIDVAHFKTHLEELLKNNLEKIEQLLQESPAYTWDDLIYPLDDLEDALERFWSPFSHLHSVMDSEALRECYDECLPLLSAYEAAIGHNKKLYEAIKSVDTTTLNATQKKSSTIAFVILNCLALRYPKRIKNDLKPFKHGLLNCLINLNIIF